MSEDRTAIVTGAARGIGGAIAQRLAKEGKAVAVLDLDQADSEAAAKANDELEGFYPAVDRR